MTVKSVLVIGGGVAGMQAAFDLAEAGITVCLVEKTLSIGGRMAQLDKTFPTNDCAICILAPKMMDCYRHENIEVLTFSEVISVEGEVGSFKVKILRRPRFIDEELCNGCGDCARVCPMGILNRFDMDLRVRSGAYIPFLQAVPLIYALDREKCMRCGLCKVVCGKDAIRYDQKPEIVERTVGAIIIATGFDPLDPAGITEYGYGHYDNVLTALEYERLISAAGPTGGHVVRKDGTEVKRIAWIQCVGARDTRDNRPYCCSVCCMHATKEAILTREHHPEVETFILYTDLRCFGKGFQEYVNRAKDDYGVVYIRGKPGEIREKEDGTLELFYSPYSDKVEILDVDMVVLCTALIPSEGVDVLAKVLGIELDEYNFFKLKDPYNPTETTRAGIFVAGYCQAPRDIPECIAHGSAAASRAMEVVLGGMRNGKSQ
ncbi:MAG: CoB--CoM heterodisulfide reductase iron-sulfur subunit A family protein [Methanophagales archaeon ANME-1-THS]|nr:MAG: CoB--CoM heterodisulfide reductase iron-sulfur subunit A family protein [Methanophagales archaeon ANME-1-THS]